MHATLQHDECVRDWIEVHVPLINYTLNDILKGKKIQFCVNEQHFTMLSFIPFCYFLSFMFRRSGYVVVAVARSL